VPSPRSQVSTLDIGFSTLDLRHGASAGIGRYGISWLPFPWFRKLLVDRQEPLVVGRRYVRLYQPLSLLGQLRNRFESVVTIAYFGDQHRTAVSPVLVTGLPVVYPCKEVMLG